MRIALLHYHLKRGGVTSVIRHQVAAIQSLGWEPLVLAGEPLAGAFPCQVRVIEGLAYDRLVPPALSAAQISRSIVETLADAWPRGAHLLHVHNPTLAKNRHMQAVLRDLQHRGMDILCQVHDFAEDGRPAAYDRGPYLADCHYAVINPRDQRLLLQAGLQSRGCHLLPNTISLDPPADHPEPGAGGVLYPIRAIRRKNIGEALLLSLFLGQNGPLIITLPPNSPTDLARHDRWKQFSRKHRLPVRFDAGLDADFHALLAGCRFVITTSITEGFGFAFLEAWAAGKPLWGRLLPDICQGFMDHGIRYDWLYTRLRVPLAWVDPARVKKRWTAALAQAHRHFDLDSGADGLEMAWRAVTTNGLIDLGLLDEPFQERVITQVLADDEHRRQLTRINASLQTPQPPEEAQRVVTANQQAIRKHYGPADYARRLARIYRRVVDTQVRHQLDKEVLARNFLAPRDFSLLKWSLPDG